MNNIRKCGFGCSGKEEDKHSIKLNGCKAGHSTGYQREYTLDKFKRYINVRHWDNGYLVADAEYEGFSAPAGEYVDLVPILENLCLDTSTVLSSIEEMRVAQEQPCQA